MISRHHFVNGHAFDGPLPPGAEEIMFGLGCFWGAERKFWQLGSGVFLTTVGYAGGVTIDPTYENVCSGHSGHAEVVKVVYLPEILRLEKLLQLFWESHDPTQGARQGNDIGTQYRSVIFTTTAEQRLVALASRDVYQNVLTKNGFKPITTDIAPAPFFMLPKTITNNILQKIPMAIAA